MKVLDNMVETCMDMGDIAQRLQATKGLMPLPKTQIDLSAGILEQNPGLSLIHISEPTRQAEISYAVFCLKKKKKKKRDREVRVILVQQ